MDLDAVVRALGDGNPEVRDAALEALEGLYVQCDGGTCTTDPEIARVALPAAIAALSDPDPGVRMSATRALRLLASDGGPAASALAAALSDPVPELRLEILGTLGEMGERAAATAHRVAEYLEHGASADERSAAAYALGNLGVPDEQVDRLVAALVDDEPSVQAGAAYALSIALERGSAHASQALRRLRP